MITQQQFNDYSKVLFSNRCSMWCAEEVAELSDNLTEEDVNEIQKNYNYLNKYFEGEIKESEDA